MPLRRLADWRRCHQVRSRAGSPASAVTTKAAAAQGVPGRDVARVGGGEETSRVRPASGPISAPLQPRRHHVTSSTWREVVPAENLIHAAQAAC
jgi:hypothetical protein